MTLKEKVLQTFIVTIREINKHGEPKEFFEKYPVGGMYYSYLKGSEGTVEVGTGLNPARLAECRAASKLPLFVCADGTAMRGQTVSTSAEAVGSIQTEEAAYNYGKLLGMQMNDNTVDWILMPIVDLLYSHEMPLFAVSNDPETTAKLNRAIIRGIQEQGVCATAKHFPGIGTCNINMHFGPGQNVLSYDEWMKTYGYVYKEAFKENLASVMTTHMTFRAYDDEGENGYYPIATYSSKLTTDLLKGELGFEGAVVTDALIMGGMATGNLIEETVQSFKAGADFLLWPPVEAADRIVEALESGEIPMSRLDDAISRIALLRNRIFSFQPKENTDVSGLAERTVKQIAENCSYIVSNELGLIPLDAKKYKKIRIVGMAPDPNECMSLSHELADEFKKHGAETEVIRNWDNYLKDHRTETDRNYDLIVYAMFYGMEHPTMMFREDELSAHSALSFDRDKTVIISFRSPYLYREYFETAETFVNSQVIGMKECVEALYGEKEFKGKASVKY